MSARGLFNLLKMTKEYFFDTPQLSNPWAAQTVQTINLSGILAKFYPLYLKLSRNKRRSLSRKLCAPFFSLLDFIEACSVLRGLMRYSHYLLEQFLGIWFPPFHKTARIASLRWYMLRENVAPTLYGRGCQVNMVWPKMYNAVTQKPIQLWIHNYIFKW